MRKNIVKIGTVTCLVVLSTIGVQITKDNNNNIGLGFENIEALASDAEGGGSNYHICYYESVVKKGYTYYDCGSCEKVYDEKGKGQYSKCFK